MSFTHTYLVPDYYPGFHCKAGDCRHSCCCSGWDVTISLEEYFKLSSLDCSLELRRMLDSALHIHSQPSESHYALLSPRYDGNCPLHLPNGYCALQAECGIDALSSCCLYYPRSPESRFDHTCACADSCERVLEMLYHEKKPLTFVPQELTFNLPMEQPPLTDPLSHSFPALRSVMILLLQNRQFSLPIRLKALYHLTDDLDAFRQKGDDNGLADALQNCSDQPEQLAVQYLRHETEVPPRPETETALRLQALSFMCAFTQWVAQDHPDLTELCQNAMNVLFPQGQVTSPLTSTHLERLDQAEQHLSELFPDLECMTEQQLVNHLFYSHFALVDPKALLTNRATAFLVSYAFPRLLAALNMANTPPSASNLTTFIDLNVSAFHLIEHTAFDKNTVILSKELGFTCPPSLADL